MLSILLRLHCAEEHQPGQDGLGHKTQYDVGPFSVQVILPLANTLILQDHVDRERVEGYEIRAYNRPHKPGYHAEVARTEHVDEYGDPWRYPGYGSPDKGSPVDPGLLPAGIELLHGEAEQIHGCIDNEDQYQ